MSRLRRLGVMNRLMKYCAIPKMGLLCIFVRRPCVPVYALFSQYREGVGMLVMYWGRDVFTFNIAFWLIFLRIPIGWFEFSYLLIYFS